MQQLRPKAIFFDWDGTAVRSRKDPVEEIVRVMKPLLACGVKLVIVSGTTVENIAGGRIEELFTEKELSNLYLGLGRGAFNYCFSGGKAEIFEHMIPDKKTLLDIHNICFDIHRELLEQYDFPTDIVFSRPNYCKIDLMVENSRGDQLFLQGNELTMLRESLKNHGILGGLKELLRLSEQSAKQYGITISPTCDAKYLEVGVSSKSDNVNTILKKLNQEYGITAEECTFWGDEYVGIEDGIFGSDSFMITELSRAGKFYDVSEVDGARPGCVNVLGGGVERFIGYLRECAGR